MYEVLIEEILFPIVAYVCVFLGMIAWFRVVVSYNKSKRIML